MKNKNKICTIIRNVLFNTTLYNIFMNERVKRYKTERGNNKITRKECNEDFAFPAACMITAGKFKRL